MQHNILCYKVKFILSIFLVLGVVETQGSENQGPQVVQSQADPYVLKVYPDGTKLLVRWSEIGKAVDHGENHGGPPKIVAYDSKQVPSGPAPVENFNSKESMFGGAPTYVPYDPGSSSPKQPESPYEGFYVSPQIGPALVQNVNLNSIAASAEISGVTIGTTQSPYLTFSTGIRFDLALGYSFNDWCSLEFSPGIIWNPLKTYGDDNVNVTVDGENYSGSGEVNLDGSFIQVPLVANLLFYIPTNSQWRPVFGGGLGANYNYLNFSKVLGIDLPDVSGSCWSLGYQAIAGFDYAFDGGYQLGLKYIFTGSTSQSFGGDLSIIGTGGSFTQTIVLDFKATF